MNLQGSYHCDCKTGYSGTNCETGDNNLRFLLKTHSKIIDVVQSFGSVTMANLFNLSLRIETSMPTLLIHARMGCLCECSGKLSLRSHI